MADAGREDEFEIDSAGTHDYHVGQPADSRMRAVAQQRGYRLDSISRQIRSDDFDRFDLLVVMDEDNYAEVAAQDPGSRARIVRLCEYCETREETHVPDPYYGGESDFHRVIDILEDACAGLMKRV